MNITSKSVKFRLLMGYKDIQENSTVGSNEITRNSMLRTMLRIRGGMEEPTSETPEESPHETPTRALEDSPQRTPESNDRGPTLQIEHPTDVAQIEHIPSPTRTKNKKTLSAILDLENELHPEGDHLSLRGYNSSILINTGGGLGPYKRNKQPIKESRIHKLASLIQTRAVDKIHLTETHITPTIHGEIVEYLATNFPDVKIVHAPMNKQSAEVIGDEQGYSGVATLMHITWFKRLTNQRPINSCAGRSLELIYTTNGAPPGPDNPALVEITAYAVSGGKATHGPGLAHMQHLSKWLHKKVADHITDNYKTIIAGDFNATQHPELGRLPNHEEEGLDPRRMSGPSRQDTAPSNLHKPSRRSKKISHT